MDFSDDWRKTIKVSSEHTTTSVKGRAAHDEYDHFDFIHSTGKDKV